MVIIISPSKTFLLMKNNVLLFKHFIFIHIPCSYDTSNTVI